MVVFFEFESFLFFEPCTHFGATVFFQKNQSKCLHGWPALAGPIFARDPSDETALDTLFSGYSFGRARLITVHRCTATVISYLCDTFQDIVEYIVRPGTRE